MVIQKKKNLFQIDTWRRNVRRKQGTENIDLQEMFTPGTGDEKGTGHSRNARVCTSSFFVNHLFMFFYLWVTNTCQQRFVDAAMFTMYDKSPDTQPLTFLPLAEDCRRCKSRFTGEIY